MKTNIEFVEDMMTFSNYGGLAQVAIIEGIRHYTTMVASTPEPTEAGNGIVSAIGWWGVCKEISEKIEKRNKTGMASISAVYETREDGNDHPLNPDED